MLPCIDIGHGVALGLTRPQLECVRPPAVTKVALGPASPPAPEQHMVANAAPEAALMACGARVDPVTLRAIIQVESGAQVYAIHVNGALSQPPPASTAVEATAEAQAWMARGYSVDLGLMQVNNRNLPSLGVTVEQMFDPCSNIQVGAAILTADFLSASANRSNPQDALKAALSAYNTGDFERGLYNGYVAKYYGPDGAIGHRPIDGIGSGRTHSTARAILANPYTASPAVYTRETDNQ